MGKVSPISIKYNIKAKFVAEGVVEKPDVIGAIFGQTEGLLGEDLELRELQKNGKIGRINVNLETKEGKTEGEIEIPTSLDKAETTIIAATLETIERIGPANVKITVENIEDIRGSKRDFVFERAKKLLEGMNLSQPTSKDIGTELTASVRENKLIEYGKEMLPAGPEIDSSEEIIVVEGRADVITLLRCGIKNAIAMNGTAMPKTISELSRNKVITLFVDGDRGGLLNAKGIASVAKIDFIAQAPHGREVEELTSKEVISSLRNKETAEDFFRKFRAEERYSSRFRQRNDYYRYPSREYSEEPRRQEERAEKIESVETAPVKIEELTEDSRAKLQEILESLTKTKNICLVDKDLSIVRKMSSSELSKMRKPEQAYALVISGTATNNMAKIAEKIGCSFLVARNFAINYKTSVNLVSL